MVDHCGASQHCCLWAALLASFVVSRNIKLVLAYDGTDFAGWQVQPHQQTIQGTLAAAIERITREKVLPQGSGRTDAGVHALAQVATCQIESPIPAPNLVVALNDTLPPAIRILAADEVATEFHPRASAKAKTYRYRIYRDDICPPFLARYVYHHPYPLDEAAMCATAQYVLGEHDFTSFAAADPDRAQRIQDANGEDDGPSNIRTIFSSQFRRERAELIYEVRGSGFLHHMVRNLVGTFLLVGKGALAPGDIVPILEARNRSAAGPTAAASGLYLVSVEYDSP
jgi:tRNA pseudouridine38-40 synthase